MPAVDACPTCWLPVTTRGPACPVCHAALPGREGLPADPDPPRRAKVVGVRPRAVAEAADDWADAPKPKAAGCGLVAVAVAAAAAAVAAAG